MRSKIKKINVILVSESKRIHSWISLPLSSSSVRSLSNKYSLTWWSCVDHLLGCLNKSSIKIKFDQIFYFSLMISLTLFRWICFTIDLQNNLKMKEHRIAFEFRKWIIHTQKQNWWSSIWVEEKIDRFNFDQKENVEWNVKKSFDQYSIQMMQIFFSEKWTQKNSISGLVFHCSLTLKSWSRSQCRCPFHFSISSKRKYYFFDIISIFVLPTSFIIFNFKGTFCW